MKVKDIMTTDVISVSPETKLVEVSEIMYKYGFHGIPVVDGKKVVGVITENDLFIKDKGILFLPTYVKLLAESGQAPVAEENGEKIKRLLELKTEDVMSADPITVSSEMDVDELLDLIRKTRFNTLPVTDEEKNLVGVVTLVDVIGMVKQSRDDQNLANARPLDELVG